MNPHFQLGNIVATPGVLGIIDITYITHLLRRHSQGDWGIIDAQDTALNNAAVLEGNRLLMSAYPINPHQPCIGYGDNTVWIITEPDRSATTVLLPNEY